MADPLGISALVDQAFLNQLAPVNIAANVTITQKRLTNYDHSAPVYSTTTKTIPAIKIENVMTRLGDRGLIRAKVLQFMVRASDLTLELMNEDTITEGSVTYVVEPPLETIILHDSRLLYLVTVRQQ